MNLKTPLRLDHLAVWVADMDKTLSFLTDVLGLKKHPMEVRVSDDDPTCGGMQAYFVDGNGLWLELIFPTAPGPGMEMLKEFGDGAIVEVNFEAVDDDYINAIDKMAEAGIEMLAMDGSPLVDGGRIDEGVVGDDASHETGQRIAYWPTSVSGGTTIEIYELLTKDETNLLTIRNKQWENEKRDLTAPRIDRVSILVEDIEATAKFYTDIMGLAACPTVFELPAGDNAFGGMKVVFIKASQTDDAWIQLVQPTSPGYASDLLKEKGNGYTLEIGVEVDDIEAFSDKMRNKGITMVTFDGSAIPAGSKSVSVEPYGDKHCYFPLEVSRGLRVMMYERGDGDNSMLRQRDAAM